MRANYCLWLVLLLLLLSAPAQAHKPSDSYLILDLDAQTPSLRWDIALRDLEHALGLDSNRDGTITWGELRARHDAIAGYALARLSLSRGDQPCRLDPAAPQQLVDHSDGPYTVLTATLHCPAAPVSTLTLDYRLLFELDPSHRGLLQVRRADGVETALLSPGQSRLTLAVATPGPWQSLVQYWREGVWHIWIGFDHILFLVTLLLPAVLWRQDGRWQAMDSLAAGLKRVVAIVTAFTVAHSITLSLTVLGWLNPPTRWVESAIALTVVLAALNNLYPLLRGRLWVIAFALGLIHGFGFAGVLADLGLPAQALIPALAGFNLGVEAGQLVIVVLFLPLAWVLRESWFYRRAVLGAGSTAVAAIALVWLLERSLNLTLMP